MSGIRPVALIGTDITRNNFDLLRLTFAIAVLFSHCYIVSQGSMRNEPVFRFSNGQTELAVIAVYGFFIISGFLITRSFEKSQSLAGYLKKRVLRIVPGFTMAFLISALIVAPIGTISMQFPSGNIAGYFEDTRWHGLLFDLLSLQPPHVANCFMNLPVPKQVNASLWTIQHEALCYLLVPTLAIAGAFYRKNVLPLAFALFFTFMLVLDLPALADVRETTTRLVNWPGYFPRFAVYFLAGAFCYTNRTKIPRDGRWAVVALISIIVTAITGGFNYLFPFAGTYLLFFVAYHPRVLLPHFARHGDFSYGTYLYAWPAQQVIWFFLRDSLKLSSFFGLSLLLTLLCAYVSWNFIERPFLMKKQAINTAGFSS